MRNLYKCNCRLIIEVILRNARCNNKVYDKVVVVFDCIYCYSCYYFVYFTSNFFIYSSLNTLVIIYVCFYSFLINYFIVYYIHIFN